MIRTAFLTALPAAALALTMAGAADAQRGGPSATLYSLPNFQGEAVTITGSTPDLGRWRFNDRAQSARFEGRWIICEHDDFKGRCQEVSGQVDNLHTYRLLAQVSSLEPTGRGQGGGYGGGGGGYGGGQGGPGGGYGRPDRDARGVEGTATVFFARPTINGTDVAAGDRAANGYCRRQGLGEAVFFDSSTRAGQAVTPDGQFIGRSTVIRDLLCRKY